MKRVLFIDNNKNDYYNILEILDKYMMSYVSHLSDLENMLYQLEPDVVIYNTNSNINLHSVISALLETDNNMVPILVFGKGEEFVNYELIFGPFSLKDSLDSIIDLGISYKNIITQNNRLKEENIYLKEGVLTDDSERKLRTFESFKTQIVQEFKRVKRTNKPLSLIITTVLFNEETLDLKLKKSREEISQKINKLILESIRDTDIPLSYDNNKVLVLMPDTDEDGLSKAIERINESISLIKKEELERELEFTLKIGKAVTNKDVRSFSELVKIAL